MAQTRVLLMRAVNVGGAKLPMAQFRALLGELGASDVRTYIASGNAVCSIDGDPAAFDRSVEQAVQQQHGYFRECISRTPEELQAALDAHPFEVVEPKYSYVNFLLEAPGRAAIARAREYPTGKDRWEVIGREQHLRYFAGAGRAELNASAIGKALGVPGTARNLNTVRALIKL